MILNDREIKKALKDGEIKIEGVKSLYIGPNSVDLHLDNKAKVLDSTMEGNLELTQDNKKFFHDHNDWNELILYPDEFYILSSIEKITFPNNIVGFIQGRSSLARIGINVHAAGFFDSGFSGNATLEVTNMTKIPIVIPKNTRICQMVFARSTPADVPYNKKKDAKYNRQKGPTLTKIHEDN